MTKNNLVKFALLTLLTLALSACGTVPPLSWPGITADEANGRVYLAYASHVTALNSDSGSQIWQYPAENGSFSSFAAPVLSDDELLVSGYNNTLYSLNPANGVENWNFAGASNHFIGSPLAADGHIFASNSDHNLYALDANGALLWTFSSGQPQWGQPAFDGNAVYVASLDHNLYAVNAANGEELWSLDLGGTLVSSPLLHEGVIYIGTLNSEVVAVDATNGSELWRTATAGWVWGTPALFESQLLVGDLSGFLYSLDPVSGEQLWQVDTDGSITGTPLVHNENIYVLNEAGRVLSLSLDGNINWNQDFNAELYGSVVTAGDLILFGQHNNTTTLVALNESGSTVWTYPQDN